MSIELKQAAQQAVDAFDAFGDADDFASLFELTQKMRALRTAIQRAEAEAQQPATGEPTPQDVVDAFEKARAGSDKPVGILRGVRAVMRLLPDLKPAPDPIAPATPEPVAVHDGVWEALQRLIENGFTLGKASADDALLVAKHRKHLLTTHPAPSVPTVPASAYDRLQALSDDQARRLLELEDAPSVFLVRDVASLLGASVPDVCDALADLGYEPRRSTNAAISPDEAIAVAKRINPAPIVPGDVARDAERWRTFLATRPSNTHEVVNAAIDAAIDAAMLAAK